jgi:hypothetical protein
MELHQKWEKEWKDFANKNGYDVGYFEWVHGLDEAAKALKISEVRIHFVLPSSYIRGRGLRLPGVTVYAYDPTLRRNSPGIELETTPRGLQTIEGSIATLEKLREANLRLNERGYVGKFIIPLEETSVPFKFVYQSPNEIDSLEGLAKIMLDFKSSLD